MSDMPGPVYSKQASETGTFVSCRFMYAGFSASGCNSANGCVLKLLKGIWQTQLSGMSWGASADLSLGDIAGQEEAIAMGTTPELHS